MMKPKTRVRRPLHRVLALVLSLAVADALAGDNGRHGGVVRSYDVATGTLLVDGRQAHVGPATKLLGYGGERISAADLKPGMSVGYEVGPAGPEGIPEIRVLELRAN
ncbi:MAG: hypothetical protein AB7S51_03085 [Porticoccaceae bacterium]